MDVDALRALTPGCAHRVLGPGDRILTGRAEYGSIVLAYLQVAQRTGAEVVVVPNDESGQLDTAELADLVDERTRLIGMSHVPTSGGLVNPARPVRRRDPFRHLERRAGLHLGRWGPALRVVGEQLRQHARPRRRRPAGPRPGHGLDRRAVATGWVRTDAANRVTKCRLELPASRNGLFGSVGVGYRITLVVSDFGEPAYIRPPDTGPAPADR